ncbi:Fn3-like domain-containing protein, partial [Microvirga sp. 3-52]|nr:Fn3-like domain-containing protein [Microvirga sp. 3-52]
SFTLNLAVTNFGDKAVEYDVSSVLLADQVENGYLVETSREVTHTTTGAESFTIEPGEVVELSTTINFEEDELPLNSFVEGFLVLTGNDSIDLS